MAKSGEEVVFEGWLTKSPPTKRNWRAIIIQRWRRRWFSLKHSGDIPDQFILTYYADRNCRKLKGFINLDDCEQVDLGLKLDDRKLQFDHVFDIKTPTRTYYLAADSEIEMKSWVNCICKVCGLKSEEEDLNNSERAVDIVFHEEKSESTKSDDIIRVSTSPYIPISECITGKTPILNQLDFQALLEDNIRNHILRSDPNHSNQTYGVSQRNYLNYVNDMQDPRFYDCPRVLSPPPNSHQDYENSPRKDKEKNSSPLQSPTDTESVFTDDDTGDVDVVVTKKYTKAKNFNENLKSPPPRPPKSLHVTPSTYINLSQQSTPTNKNELDVEDKILQKPPQEAQKLVTDDMYDFPRSHNVETEAVKNLLHRRHCYNNAAPVKVLEGQIFRYDISPKPSTSSSQVFKYDEEDIIQGEPASPLSQTSSTTPYSNLPSPLLTAESQLMPPPIVNRDLKPKRKLSDSLSSCSNPEPGSPRGAGAPCVDRKLKPPTLQEISKKGSPCLSVTRKTLSVDEDSRKLLPSPKYTSEDETRRIRAAPSPTPPGFRRSCDSLLSQENQEEQIYHYLPGKMQYLDLDLDCGPSNFSGGSLNNSSAKTKNSDSSSTVYKKVDFEKTQAFNITRNNLEKERQEPVTFTKK